MSITEEAPVDATECGQRYPQNSGQAIEKAKEFPRLPPSFGKRLTAHAACASHEDVPYDLVTANGDVRPVMFGGLPMSFTLDRISAVPHLQPPANFGVVEKSQIYRSSYPQVDNFGYLKSLGLKTILTLVPEPISPEYAAFMRENGIQHFQVHIPANKEAIRIGACEMTRALDIVLDRRNHPILIHCNKGKHRTGCVVGCFRRVQGVEPDHIFPEYHYYAGVKARIFDEAFIDQFDENTVLWMVRKYNWISSVEPPSPVSISTPL